MIITLQGLRVYQTNNPEQSPLSLILYRDLKLA